MKIHDEQTQAWTWKALGPPPPPAKPPMPIRTKATLQAPAMLAVAAVMYLGFDHVVVPAIVAGLSVLVLIGGWCAPPLFHALERGGKRFGLWVVTAVNWILLVPLYLLMFGLGRLILAVRGLDPMDRAYPAKGATCWLPRQPVPGPEQYRRQH